MDNVKKTFRIVKPGTNESVMGETPLPEDNVYIRGYAHRLQGEKNLQDLEVGEGSLHEYRLSGERGVYKIVRVS